MSKQVLSGVAVGQQIASPADSGFASVTGSPNSAGSGADSDGQDRRSKQRRVTPMAREVVIPAARAKLRSYLNEFLNPYSLSGIHYAEDEECFSMLELAIGLGLTREASLLIDMAPHPDFVNIVTDDSLTALHLAVMSQQPRIVRQLILSGADPLALESEGDTALHLACMWGDLECARALTDAFTIAEESTVKRLSKKGLPLPSLPQDLEILDDDGFTCVHLAVMNGHVEVVRHLVSLGADLQARRECDGNGVLHLAIMNHQREMTMALLHIFYLSADVCNYAGISAYQVALENREYVIAAELARLGASTSDRV